jgi:hypothetical protein
MYVIVSHLQGLEHYLSIIPLPPPPPLQLMSLAIKVQNAFI